MTFKVGDELIANEASETCGMKKGSRHRVEKIIANEFHLEEINTGKITYWIDFGPNDNVSTYFFLSAPVRQWQVGDKFKVHPHPGVPWYGFVSKLPSAPGATDYELLDDKGRYWEWTTWDSFLREAIYENTCTTQRPVLCCTRCREYNEYAQANQPDGTFKCHQCRSDPWR